MMSEIKNTLEGINRISEAEQISELEDKMMEITSEEQNKVKRMKRTEDGLRDLWDNIRCTMNPGFAHPSLSNCQLSVRCSEIAHG